MSGKASACARVCILEARDGCMFTENTLEVGIY